jgi:hypothetical protein
MKSFNFKILATNEVITVIAKNFDAASLVLWNVGISSSQREYLYK